MSGRGAWRDGAPAVRGAWCGDKRSHRPIIIPSDRRTDRSTGTARRIAADRTDFAARIPGRMPATTEGRTRALYG